MRLDSKAGDYSGLAIVVTNVFVIGLAVYQNWDIGPLMIIYWAQSVIIGVFNFLRMILLDRFSTDGMKSGGKPVAASASGKWSTAIFFAIHYGIFHAVYASLIFGAESLVGLDISFGDLLAPEQRDALWIAVAVGAFLVGHLFSFWENVARDLQTTPNLGKLMFLPYARIFPMHLTLMFGFILGSNRIALLLFLALKTFADWRMHIAEHRILQQSGAPPERSSI